jgi:hypothetical protein
LRATLTHKYKKRKNDIWEQMSYYLQQHIWNYFEYVVEYQHYWISWQFTKFDFLIAGNNLFKQYNKAIPINQNKKTKRNIRSNLNVDEQIIWIENLNDEKK